MAKDSRSTYEVTINGMKHVVLLDQGDADNWGPAAKKVKAPTVAQADETSDADGASADDTELVDPLETETASNKTTRRR